MVFRHELLRLIAGAFCLVLATAAMAQPSNCTPKYNTNSPLVSLDANGTTITLQEAFSFTDAHCRVWSVPKLAVADGASIPRSLWSAVGSPLTGPYRNAAIIHDWYCAVRTRPWQDVHQMFYDAMIASNVPATKAKLMYFGVRVGGPQWDELTMRNANLLSTGVVPPELANVASLSNAAAAAASIDKPTLDAAIATLAKQNLSLPQVAQMADDVKSGRVVPNATALSAQAATGFISTAPADAAYTPASPQ